MLNILTTIRLKNIFNAWEGNQPQQQVFQHLLSTCCFVGVKEKVRQVPSISPFSLREKVERTSALFSWCAKSIQSCLTLCHPMDCSLPASSVHRILQARILEWVAIPSLGNIPGPGIKHRSPELQADSLLSESPTCFIHLPK